MTKLLLAAATLAVAASAHAATITKANNTDDLSLGSSWTGGVAPGAGDIAQFDTSIIGTGSNTYDFTSNLTWQVVRVDRATATAGGTETIGSSNGSTLTLTASRALANIGTTTNFINESAIVLNSSSGASLVLNSGIVLAPTANSASLITSSRALTVNGAITLAGNSLDLFAAGSTTKLAGAITGTGAITKLGSGILEITGNNANFTGAFVSKGSGASGTAIGLNGLANASSVTLTTSALTIGSNGTTTINNLSGASGTIIRTDYTIGGGAAAARTLVVNQSVDGTFAGNFSNEGTGGRSLALNKQGGAKLTLTGSNTLSGGVTVNNGSLAAGSLTAFGTGAVAVNGGTLELGGFAVTNAITLAGGTLGNSGAAVTRAGDVALAAASSIGGTGDITLGGAITGAFGLTKVGTGTVTLNGANAATGITVTAGTLKAGTATALGGGAVAVNGGALDLNGFTIANDVTLSGTGSLTNSAGTGIAVNNLALGTAGTVGTNGQTLTVGGALTGSGTINGNVAVNGTLAIGNSPGLITVNGDTTLSASTASLFEIAGIGARGTAYDALTVTGTLTLDGTIAVVTYGGFDTTTLTAGTTYDLLDWGTLNASGFNIASDLDLSGLALAGGLEWDTTNFLTDGTISVVVTAVPEPSTYGLMGAGALAAMAFVRRRRKLAGKVA